MNRISQPTPAEAVELAMRQPKKVQYPALAKMVDIMQRCPSAESETFDEWMSGYRERIAANADAVVAGRYALEISQFLRALDDRTLMLEVDSYGESRPDMKAKMQAQVASDRQCYRETQAVLKSITDHWWHLRGYHRGFSGEV